MNVGALGIGPLVAGCLAQWARRPLTLPYLLFVALGALALIGLATAPETGAPQLRAHGRRRGPTDHARPGSRFRPRQRPSQRSRPTGCSPGWPGSSWPPHSAIRPTRSPAPRSSWCSRPGVVAQLATAGSPASRVLALGTASMLVGLALLVTAVRLSTPSLALFLIAGALIGGGAGAVFKGTTGLVLAAAAPEDRLAMTSQLLIALFIGLSIPGVGAGVALDRGASAPDTVLGFADPRRPGCRRRGLALLGHAGRRGSG